MQDFRPAFLYLISSFRELWIKWMVHDISLHIILSWFLIKCFTKIRKNTIKMSQYFFYVRKSFVPSFILIAWSWEPCYVRLDETDFIIVKLGEITESSRVILLSVRELFFILFMHGDCFTSVFECPVTL